MTSRASSLSMVRVATCGVVFGTLLIACGDSEPRSEETSGDESAIEAAERNANEAHERFKQEVKPTADFIDQKANEAVDEGKKAVRKVGDAID